MVYIIVVNILSFLLHTHTNIISVIIIIMLCSGLKTFLNKRNREKVETLSLLSSLFLECNCFHVSYVCFCKCVYSWIYMCVNIKFVFVPVLVVVALCSLRNFLMFFWCSSFSTWKNLEIRTAAFLPFLFIIFSAYVLENVSLYTLCKNEVQWIFHLTLQDIENCFSFDIVHYL